MELKTEKEINNYTTGYNKLVVMNKNRPCIYWNCSELNGKQCDKALCPCCVYYGCCCCIHRDECVLKVLNKS